MDPTHDMPPAIRLRGLRKGFATGAGRVTAVDGIDLTVGRGEIVAFLGPNGAGKTTTIDMLLGLTEPDAGTAEVLGLPPRRAVRSGRVSAVLQTGGLLRDLTVRETVQAIASLHRAGGRVAEVMERTSISGIAGRRVSKCSGGEQQRLKFALALLPDPDLLILDEPTAGMDVNARRDFWETMRQDADSGRTVLFATHYLEEAEQFAQRTVLIVRGGIVADGTTSQVRSMASGRAVSATLPALAAAAGTAGDHPVLAVLRGRADVRRLERSGARITATATDSDALAMALLRDFGAHDLEVSAPSLESAFVDLTRGGSAAVPAAPDAIAAGGAA
ncbi:MAG: ABC transporter ATP-binding protein [Arthrobacter sp.]|uniref:ABC transporter ATP-binding protein n=1 Tax=Arthrobacter sp. TaxID=1667 RepID=UPI00347A4F31